MEICNKVTSSNSVKATFSTLVLLLFIGGIYSCGVQSTNNRSAISEEISLVLAHSNLGLVRNDMRTCVVSVYPVEGGVLGGMEGTQRVWDVNGDNDQTKLTVTNLNLGLKEIHLQLLNSAKLVVAERKFRLNIDTGSRNLKPIQIQLVPNQRTVDVEAVVTARSSNATITYTDVKSIFAEHCVRCHNTAFPLSGLNLDAFPFRSRTETNQSLIVAGMLSWLRNTSKPMPPPPANMLPEATVDLIERWLDGGLQIGNGKTKSAASHEFSVTLEWKRVKEVSWNTLKLAKKESIFKGRINDVLVGDRLSYRLSVFDEANTLVHKAAPEQTTIAPTGPLKIRSDFTFDESF